MGTFNITQETDLVVPNIFRMANSLATAPGGWKTTVDWTSGYFSVQERYREFVLDAKANVRIMAASPEVSFGPLFEEGEVADPHSCRPMVSLDHEACQSTSHRLTRTL